jgi:serine/threonine protein kinase
VLQQGKDLEEADLIGRQVGNYRIKRLLGRGGMGAVYEMVHESIGQRSAIKILFSKYAQDPEFVERFFAEAKVVNRIEHPGVAKTLDHGQFPDGNLYIIMELLLGESLRARLETLAKKHTRYDLAASAALMLQLVDTLQEVHGKGVIHRDLKPENIFLVQDSAVSGGERAKILDFGIAKIQDGSTLKDVDSPGPLTTVGKILGTPTYMSPEQCEGRVALTSASDIYALGVIFYEMLSGKPPFGGVSENAVMALHMLREPVPLSQIPRSLNSLVQAMLAKQPSQRPTLPQIRSILQSYLARPDSTPWASRWLVMVMIGMCSLGILALFWTTGRRNIAPAPTTPGSDLAARPDLLTLPHDLAAVPSAQLSPPSSSDGGAGNTVIPRAVAVSPAPMGAERSGVPSPVATIPKGSRKQPVARPIKASAQPVEPEKLQVPIVE